MAIVVLTATTSSPATAVTVNHAPADLTVEVT
jgi:hypothetical protein